jgi:hypothetical protein
MTIIEIIGYYNSGWEFPGWFQSILLIIFLLSFVNIIIIIDLYTKWEHNGYERKILLTEYIENPYSYWNSKPKDQKLLKRVIEGFKEKQIKCIFKKKEGTNEFIHTLLFEFPNDNYQLKIRKVMIHLNHEFRFIIYSIEKQKKDIPSHLIEVIDQTFE